MRVLVSFDVDIPSDLKQDSAKNAVKALDGSISAICKPVLEALYGNAGPLICNVSNMRVEVLDRAESPVSK